MKKVLIIIVLAAFVFTACGKTCRCYRRDGNVDEFDMSELEEEGFTCSEMEYINYGLTYSLCERVL